jgi:hypothetical protein
MRGSSRSGDTAETLILVGLILDIIGEVILLGIGLLFLAFAGLGFILLGFALIGFVWIALVWSFSYSRVREGDYEGARTPTLVFAILSLLTLALIPGILFLIAYVKLGDAIDSTPRGAPAWSAVPSAPALASMPPATAAPRYCAHCGRPSTRASGFCEGCGAPLA